ncbi:MAG: phospholipase D-like domain-containing protein [Bacteroidota bacterium]|nr:phospholipase D-like domain-containing protein [Bacteroidota bacterium]
MIDRIILTLCLMICSLTSHAQLISISDARALPLGSTVTVNGIVTSGQEFGTIRYIQDGTAGIAIFSSSFAVTQRGDNVTVTGVTTDYQNLLEITPVTGWILNSSANPLPVPLQLTPNQVGESNEAMLVKINNVSFTNGGSLFQGNASYSFTANGESGIVYIRSGNPLVGEVIPSSGITLYAICSQFGNQYQLLPRDEFDLVSSSAISITTPPYPQNISTSGFTVAWNTNINGDAFLRYGNTSALELGVMTGPTNTTNPSIIISGADPAELFYAQAFSVSGTDTAFATSKAYITASNSTGAIKVYFNRPVDQYVANPSSNTATYLPNAFDDTLKAIIDRSMLTLDIAIYSMDNAGTAQIVQAINDAYIRGVQIRVVAEGGNTNAGLQSLNAAIPVLLSPTVPVNYYGIMHNKFFIIDAEDTDASKPIVMSGSTNWSIDQLNSDRNNLVFIQDQSLAKVYRLEFEEMWGGNGPLPVPANSKFGPDKSDNTPHELLIGGKRVESFFSPSDDTNNQILRSIQSANSELYFATMVFTRFDLAYAVEERVDIHNIYAAGIMDDSAGGSGVSFLIMQGAMGNSLILFDHVSQPGIMHHKYLIVDQGNIVSDPLVLTGSHNWSSGANIRNDENTLIIHDAAIANQYYQEFHNMYNSSGGNVGIAESNQDLSIIASPNPVTDKFTVAFLSAGNENYTIYLTDISGKVIYRDFFEAVAGWNSFAGDASGLPGGMYFVNVKNGALEYHTKLMVR